VDIKKNAFSHKLINTKIIFGYSFNVEDASNYGVDCAVMIKNIDFWISKIKLTTNIYTMGNFGLIIQDKHFFDIISFGQKIK
jgi:hypothetical protein